MILRILFNRLRALRCSSRCTAFLMFLRKDSYLKQSGWYDSFRKAMPIDKEGVPIPWYTYAAIDFLKSRVDKTMTIFEYGSGNSTMWWAKHAARVVSCEHDQQWFSLLERKLPDNVTYMHVNLESGGDYSKCILQHENEFDVIIIDGRDRVNCANNALGALNDAGIIIWDNSERDKYLAGYDFLTTNGFKRLDFSGLGPINTFGWCTSVFYREQNCLGL